jgi:hypothetical protein
MAPVGPLTALSRQLIDRAEDGNPDPQQLRNAGTVITISYSAIAHRLPEKGASANGLDFEAVDKTVVAENSVIGQKASQRSVPPNAVPKALGQPALCVLKYVFRLPGKASENGERQNDAILRDGFSHATLLLAEAGAFPAGYISERIKALALGQQVSEEITLASEKKLEELRGLKALISREARDGQSWALDYDLRSDKQLENLKKSDAIFAARFGETVAFREGVLSMVWLAKNRPADFDTRQQIQMSGGVASGPAGGRG